MHCLFGTKYITFYLWPKCDVWLNFQTIGKNRHRTLSHIKTPSDCHIKRCIRSAVLRMHQLLRCCGVKYLHPVGPLFPMFCYIFFSNYPIRWTLKAVCIWMVVWNGLNLLMHVLMTIKGGGRCSLLTIWWRTSSIFSKRKTSWKTHTSYFLPTMGSI